MLNDERYGLPSASAMPRLVLCPGSPALEAQLPKDEDAKTDEALEGEAIHAAIEEDSDEDLDAQGKTIAQRLRDMEVRAVEEWMATIPVTTAARSVPQRETRLWIRDRNTLDALASAKLDVFYTMGTYALALDFKSGYLPVEAARTNIQMRTQALALWHEFEYLTHIRVATAQFRFKGQFTASDYTVPDLEKAEKELVFNLWRAQQPDAPRVPSAEACRYCRAKAICPEARAMAMLPAAILPNLPNLDVAKKDIPAFVLQLSLPQRAFLRHHDAFIRNVLEANAHSLRRETPEDLALVGLQLVPSNGYRTLHDVQKLWEVLHGIGVKDHQFRALLKAVYGTTQAFLAEKLIAEREEERKAHPEEGKAPLSDKEAKKMADEILAPAVKMAPREPQLRSL
jgi:hypothetical protein